MITVNNLSFGSYPPPPPTEKRQQNLINKGIPAQLPPSKIIIVDDDPSIGRCLALFLREEGYEVVCFADPRVALEHLKTSHQDLLVTDIQMPEMSGLELIARAIKPSLPVITMSGAWDEETSYVLSKLGVRWYLAKPFDLAYFATVVNQALSNPNLHGPPR